MGEGVKCPSLPLAEKNQCIYSLWEIYGEIGMKYNMVKT
jgi:hypothetical protein